MTQAPSIKEALELAIKFIESHMHYSQPAPDMGEEPSDMFTNEALPVVVGLNIALATFQPDGERREAIAFKIYSHSNNPKLWDYPNSVLARDNAYSIADLLLASGLVQNEAGIREKARLEAVAWAAQGLLNADTFVSDLPRAEAVSRATLKLQQALGTWQMHHCAVKAARDGGAET